MSTSSTIPLDADGLAKKKAEATAERKAMLTWVSIIVFFLFGSVGMWLFAAYIAVSDPTMAVVPDYHEKALQWDKHLDNVREAESQRWSERSNR